MEWVFALIIALAVGIWGVLFILRKLVRLVPPMKKLQSLSAAISEAQAKNPTVSKPVSVINDDPTTHVSKRLELKRAAVQRKLQRERRLRSRVL